MKPGNKNSYKSLNTININSKDYKYYSLLRPKKMDYQVYPDFRSH